MTIIKRIALGLAIGASILVGAYASLAYGTVYQGYQGGTGYGTGNNPASSTVGEPLIVASTSPFLTWSISPFPANTTTTINGVQGPTFTFSIVSTSSASSITTSSTNIFLNLLALSSSSDITITPTGSIIFASHNISQFTNNANFTTTTIQSVLNSLSVSSPITYATSTGVIACPTCLTGNQTITLTGPVTGSGATSITTTITSPLTVNVSTTQVTSTNITDTGIAAGSFIATDANHNFIATSSPSGASSVGSAGYVQYASSTGGKFDSTSSYTYASSTGSVTSLNTITNVITKSSIPSISGSFASSTSFAETGATTTWTVPSGVTSIIINAKGAGGGTYEQGPTSGGTGASVTGTLSVTPGEVLCIAVGGAGNNSNANGGYNGGGAGITLDNAGAGGWTGIMSSCSFSTSTAILIAAGGGAPANAENGGNADGGNYNGIFGQGSNSTANQNGAGGGGYLGGAVGNDSGGGGGMSFTTSTLTSTSTSATGGIYNTNGSITFTYNLSNTINGSNEAFRITMNIASSTSLIIFSTSTLGNFSNANGVSCTFAPNNATNTYYDSASTSSVAVTWQNTITTNQSFNGLCLGY